MHDLQARWRSRGAVVADRDIVVAGYADSEVDA
jgi:hypothetical protein